MLSNVNFLASIMALWETLLLGESGRKIYENPLLSYCDF